LTPLPATSINLKEIIHDDCRHFRGDRPCAPHKREGVHCEGCPHYDPITRRILIIKLGAVGDVIRTTPLLHVLRGPGVHITWLTDTPEVLPTAWIDRMIKLTPATLAFMQATRFDALYNLDKDVEAISLCRLVKANEKYGFTLDDSVCVPVDERARAKWLTGVFDDLNRINTLSYPEEIFAICGLEFKGEKYILELEDHSAFALDLPRPLIGLNTGAGARWPSRLWSYDHWVQLVEMLQNQGLGVLLLGGPDEDEKNRTLAAATGAAYLGTFPLKRFFHLVNEVDVLVTGVTMALHIGLGLGKRLVLMNSIFNRHEFELYGLGQIIEPDVDCLGCFKPVCEKDCINIISAQDIFAAVLTQVGKL
jgi:ADP-heptose:LPS heptosyltransferase